MKTKLLPIVLLTLITSCNITSCTKDEIVLDIPEYVISEVETIEESTTETESTENTDTSENSTTETKTVTRSYSLYKESYYNQRSGIVFRWGDYRPDNQISHSTNLGTFRGWFAGGQSYHDVNNDGYQDILVTYHSEGNTSTSTDWYLNRGDNKNFEKTNLVNQSTNGLSSHKILKTDVNNDNLADFILLGVDETEQGNYGGNFTVLKQLENGTFDLISIDDGKGLWYHNGAAGDLNNDGFVDVVTATYIWLGDGTGNFINTNITLEDYNVNPSLTYEIIDIDNDGYNDIIAGTNEKHTSSAIILGNFNGFDLSNNVVYLPNTNTESTFDFEFLDVDSDGDLDILEIKGTDGNGNDSTITSIYTYINDNLNFTTNTELFNEGTDGGWINGNLDKHGWSCFKIDDVDGDGIDDMVAENYADGNYNGLKYINNTWKKHKFLFGN